MVALRSGPDTTTWPDSVPPPAWWGASSLHPGVSTAAQTIAAIFHNRTPRRPSTASEVIVGRVFAYPRRAFKPECVAAARVDRRCCCLPLSVADMSSSVGVPRVNRVGLLTVARSREPRPRPREADLDWLIDCGEAG